MKYNNLNSLLATLLLAVSMSQTAFALNWSKDKTVYFDNSVTQWSAVYIIIGRGDYSRAYPMEAVENTTLYKYTMSPAWVNYTEFVIASSVGKSSLDGGGVKITDAYSTCTSRTNSFSKNVESNILITVTGTPTQLGNTTSYPIESTTTFKTDNYKVPLVPKKATHLMIFNTKEPTRSANLWTNKVDAQRYNTTILKTANGTTLSYYDNSINQYYKSAPYADDGEGWEYPNCSTFIGYVETEKPDTFPDGILYYRAASIPTNIGKEPFSKFTHLSADFRVSHPSPRPGQKITLTATPDANATLYKDAGNSAEYAFYVKDAAGTISCISNFSTTSSSATYTTPDTAQTITLYCYIRDLYGLETLQYTKEIETKLPATKKVADLMIFNTKDTTKSAWLWHENGKQYETEIKNTFNGTTLSYYDNADNKFSKAIPFKINGTSTTWQGDFDKNKVVSYNIETTRLDTFPDRVLYFRYPSVNPPMAEKELYKFITFTHLSAVFGVSHPSPCVKEEITLTATPDANATLYKDAGNSAEYAFYVKDAAGTISCISDFSTKSSATYTAPATPQTITLYCYVRDLYGLETMQYAKEIKVMGEYAYRLVYVEKEEETVVLFHPSHVIASADGSQRDTLSMYVKPFERKNSGENPHTCEIWLQQYLPAANSTMAWETKQNINIKDYPSTFTANGVYNFVLVQNENGVPLPIAEVHPYLGNYYIRLGLDANYRKDEKQFHFSDYASKYDDRFDHYFCKWMEQGKDIRFTVACDYSDCLTDTLVQEPEGDPHHAYTDANGILKHDANIRFMWNSENNRIDRAYIAGGGSNIHLLSATGIQDMAGREQTDMVLPDAENWVYQQDVYALTGALVKLLVSPYNGAPESEYLYFKGAAGEDFTKENAVQLIGGTTGQTLKVRVLYDFKSNHLISAWLPDDSNEISGELPLQSDLILIRKEHSNAQQITFSDANASITKVSQAYGVVSLSRSHFADKDVPANAKKFYWISFPFDVHLSEVFSSISYGSQYIIKYYDGAERAAKGNWIDSPSFWKMYTKRDSVVLKKGVGYLLHVNCNDTAKFFAKGNETIHIYFPSANTDSMTISGEIETVTVPKHTCTIQRDHRYIYDSNWNLIGVPSWANVNEMGLPKATEIEGISVKFLYDYVPETNGYNTVEKSNYNFGSMKAYLVQFAGTIDWKNKSITPSQNPLRAPAAPAEKTVRLELLRGEEVLDHTFVQLSEAEGITDGFDLNSDLTKIHNSGSNLYTLIGSEQIEAAANILPYSEQTVYVPLGVVVDGDGTYTFSLPEEMEGMDVRIADAETGYTHNLLLSPYEVALTAGTYTQRFSLEIHAASNVTTGCSETGAAGERLLKLLLDGHLFIQRGEKVYDAQGRQIR